MNNVVKGKIGEWIAVIYLILHFYRIVERNYRAKTGEIDIIAKKHGYTIFVEVKYRKNVSKGYPREAVNGFKQNQIKRTAAIYLMQHNLTDSNISFDVIEIIGTKVEHIKNAFW